MLGKTDCEIQSHSGEIKVSKIKEKHISPNFGAIFQKRDHWYQVQTDFFGRANSCWNHIKKIGKVFFIILSLRIFKKSDIFVDVAIGIASSSTAKYYSRLTQEISLIMPLINLAT